MPDDLDRFLIAARNSDESEHLLKEVKSFVERAAGASIKKSSPGRLVVEMRPGSADKLRSRFGERIIVERDAPLKL